MSQLRACGVADALPRHCELVQQSTPLRPCACCCAHALAAAL